jgi:hypothetical protein
MAKASMASPCVSTAGRHRGQSSPSGHHRYQQAGGNYLFSGSEAPALTSSTSPPPSSPPAHRWRAASPSREQAQTTGVDDLNDENGIDVANTALSGISSIVFNLTAGTEPIDSTSENGKVADGTTPLTPTSTSPSTSASSVPNPPLHLLAGYQRPQRPERPAQNADTDTYGNLLEYALCQNPATGVQKALRSAPASTPAPNPADGKVEAFYHRRAGGGQQDITYTLEVLPELEQSPVGWTTSSLTPVITDLGDGTEKVYYPDLALEPAFAGSDHGFVRLRVTLNGTRRHRHQRSLRLDPPCLPCSARRSPCLTSRRKCSAAWSIASMAPPSTSPPPPASSLTSVLTAGTPAFIEVTAATTKATASKSMRQPPPPPPWRLRRQQPQHPGHPACQPGGRQHRGASALDHQQPVPEDLLRDRFRW